MNVINAVSSINSSEINSTKELWRSECRDLPVIFRVEPAGYNSISNASWHVMLEDKRREATENSLDRSLILHEQAGCVS